MAQTKVTSPGITDLSVTVDKLENTLDLSTKTVTLPTSALSYPTFTSITPSTTTNDSTSFVIVGTNFGASGIPTVEFQNLTGGIVTSTSVVRNSATQLTVVATLPVDGTYYIRIELNTGLAVRSSTAGLTISDAPAWTTGSGTLGTIAGDFSGAVATVAATGDTVAYSEVSGTGLTGAGNANCSLNTSTGAITTTDFGGSSTTPTTYNFTIRATDAQGQTADRAFSLTSSFEYTMEWLVIGGGASGATYYRSGGGGAGGYRNSYASEQSGRLSTGETAWTVTAGDGAVTVTVGAGGIMPADNNLGVGGGSSSIAASGETTVTSYGGGGGGNHATGNAPTGTYGSGGGAGDDDTNSSGSSGTAGQGFGGGNGSSTQTGSQGAGGGGAGEVGFNTTGTDAMDGGDGMASSITGTSVYRAGGGGGGGYSSLQGTGGNGGGGTGGIGSSAPAYYPTSGANASDGYNSGSGGGGNAYTAVTSGTLGSGDDGVVFLRMPTADYSGTTSGSPTVLTDGTDTILVFQASGSYTR